MISDNRLQEYINIWQKEAGIRPPDKNHLQPEKIYLLAEPGGFSSAKPDELDHLSCCPVCMADWTFWARVHATDELEMKEDEPATISGGMLKAAASPGEREALKLKSACGRFLLGILPEIQTSEHGLITIEAIDDVAKQFDKLTATVCDATGRTILKGTFKHGRIATKCQALHKIELSSWTVVIT